jgi:hypothetical protein
MYEYQNGNVEVTIDYDGTSVRKWPGDSLENAKPEFPCSIDFHLTNFCTNNIVDGGSCGFCHESSTMKGRHADLVSSINILKGLPKGVEIAIGGGNPLSYPQLDEFLQNLRDMGLVANLTVNSRHINEYFPKIIELYKNSLINGLGISYNPKYRGSIIHLWKTLEWIMTPEFHEYKKNPRWCIDRMVLHAIAGVDNPEHFRKELSLPKMLVLGYKQFGMGKKFFMENSTKVNNNIKVWRYWISTIMGITNVSFDNLALEQLDIKNRVPEDIWKKYYLGEDGTFSMYIDSVKQEFAIGSTSKRFPIGNMTIKELFNVVKEMVSIAKEKPGLVVLD